jgi:hypothetical protein
LTAYILGVALLTASVATAELLTYELTGLESEPEAPGILSDVTFSGGIGELSASDAVLPGTEWGGLEPSDAYLDPDAAAGLPIPVTAKLRLRLPDASSLAGLVARGRPLGPIMEDPRGWLNPHRDAFSPNLSLVPLSPGGLVLTPATQDQGALPPLEEAAASFSAATFSQTAMAVPEPNTLLLLFMGIGVIAVSVRLSNLRRPAAESA